MTTSKPVVMGRKTWSARRERRTWAHPLAVPRAAFALDGAVVREAFAPPWPSAKRRQRTTARPSLRPDLTAALPANLTELAEPPTPEHLAVAPGHRRDPE